MRGQRRVSRRARARIRTGAAAALILLLAGSPDAARAQISTPGSRPASAGPAWAMELGLHTGLRLDGTDAGESTVGAGALVAVVRMRETGPDLGLELSATWFDDRLDRVYRGRIAAVAEVPLPLGPLRLRGGPGLGLARIVDRDFPPPDAPFPGDGLVSIGTHGTWGGQVGLSLPVRVDEGVGVTVAADLVHHRAGDRGLTNLRLGGRVAMGF